MVWTTDKYTFLVFKMVMSPSVGNKEIKQDTSSSGDIIDGIDRWEWAHRQVAVN